MKFKELEPGLVIHHGPVTVDEAEMLAFARAYDPQWFTSMPNVPVKAAGVV